MTSRLEQHLAWPETRIGHLITWLDRPDMEGWSNEMIMDLMYKKLAEVDMIDEAHF